MPAIGVGHAPAHLSPVARAFWIRWAPVLTRLRVLTETDAAILGATAEAFASFRAADRIVRAEGITLTEFTKAGTSTKRHPADIARAAWHDRWVAGLASLGMSPVAKSKVSTAADTGPDPMDDLLGAIG